MKAVRSTILPVSLSLVAGVVGLCLQAPAQNQSGPGDGAQLANASGPKKPVHKSGEVLTDDPVALLSLKPADAGTGESAPREKASAVAAAPVAASAEKDAAAEDTEKKAAEIASLKSQIQDKMKRITLLMRLFVNDEKPFIVDPGHAHTDETSEDRRKYEQDELLWETAELAKLKARLNATTSGK